MHTHTYTHICSICSSLFIMSHLHVPISWQEVEGHRKRGRKKNEVSRERGMKKEKVVLEVLKSKGFWWVLSGLMSFWSDWHDTAGCGAVKHSSFFLQKCFLYIPQLSQMWILGNGQSLGANIYVIFETQEIKTEHCLWHLLTTSLAQR